MEVTTSTLKVEDIPANGEIAVPNDATNESRALYLLQSAGLIKLDVSGTALATVANIKENPKNLKITELDASQTARSLSSVDAAVVNNTFVTEAKWTTRKHSLKSKLTKTQNNGITSSLRKKIGNHHLKLMQSRKIIAAYHTDEVKKVIEETSDGLDQPVW